MRPQMSKAGGEQSTSLLSGPMVARTRTSCYDCGTPKAKAPRRSARQVILLLLGLILIGFTAYRVSPHRVRVGREYALGGEYALIPLASSEGIAAELARIAPQFRWLRVSRLIESGQVVPLDYGDRVVVLSVAVFDDVPIAEVRALDARNARCTGWISQDLLK